MCEFLCFAMTVKIGFKPHHLIPPFVRNLDREGVIVLMEIMMPMMKVIEMLTMMVLMEVWGNTRQVRLVQAIDGVTGQIYFAPPVVKMVTSITFLLKCS